METDNEQAQSLELTSLDQAHEAVRGAANDVINNKITPVVLRMESQQELSQKARALTLEENPPKPEAESIDDQVVKSAEQILEQIHKKTGGKTNDFIARLLGEIVMSGVTEKMELVTALKQVRTAIENLEVLAGQRPGREKPPLIRSRLGVFFDLTFIPERQE